MDVYRMKRRKKKGQMDEEENPMMRFQGRLNPMNEYYGKPLLLTPMIWRGGGGAGDWESTFREGSKWSAPQFLDLRDQGGMALRQERPTDGLVCTTCDGKGKTPCITCDGKGQVMQNGRLVNCLICKGEKLWFCADCQATG